MCNWLCHVLSIEKYAFTLQGSQSNPIEYTYCLCFCLFDLIAAVRAVKTYIRTKSGKIIERVVFLSAEDYEKFTKGGGKASDILKKYLTKEEAGNLESWDKEEVTLITESQHSEGTNLF